MSQSESWNSELLKNPHAVADKRSRVQRMFSAIAPSYDFNNRLHSLWLDQYWRRVAVKMSGVRPGEQIVDVACGTGDLALRFARRQGPGQIIGVDFTYAMLPLARRKATSQDKQIAWINGDAMALPLPDGCADVASIAFGIRNVVDPSAALREFVRILKPGGRVIVLEFSLPTNPLLRGLYNFYFRKILPFTAGLISRDRTGAYRYLPESVNTFIGRPQMVQMMQQAGLTDIQQRPLTCGVCVCYRGTR